jgi:hypothetical protein
MHMREAIDKIMGDFNKFTEEHAVFKGWVVPSTCPRVCVHVSTLITVKERPL